MLQIQNLYRHRWTGRYEAHLWDNTCRREGQSRKGRQGNNKLTSNHLMFILRVFPLIFFLFSFEKIILTNTFSFFLILAFASYFRHQFI